MSKLKLILVVLVCAGTMAMAQNAAANENEADWIVWLDGSRYVPEWKLALQAVSMMMKPGEKCIISARDSAFRFVRTQDDTFLSELDTWIRQTMESSGRTIIQLREEMQRYMNNLDNSGIRNYMNSRKQMLEMYSQSHQAFWKKLDEGLMKPGSRLVVLVQQFDVPGYSREVVGNAGEWSIELQDCSPWEEKTKVIKKIAEKLKTQNNRVDGFYLKTRGRTNRDDFEVSKALFSGVTRLCKTSGGFSGNLNADVNEIASALKK